MKILGIGNAIVDVLCKVDDEFLIRNSLTKSTMKLIDETEFKNLLSGLSIEDTISGGSVANSIVGLSQLGNDVGFIGKINDDDLGQKYEDGLKKENVNYLYSKKDEPIPTGSCLILITPDSERTMCTFLGTAGKINDSDIDAEIIKSAEITLLEGYLWDEGEPKKAFDKAINNSKKVAMSLSDKFCVDRHKSHFLELVKNKLDITFANEEEIKSLIDANNFNEVIEFAKKIKKLLVITRGDKGAISINGNEINEIGIEKNLKLVDLTGAGDLFAAGYLHGIINNLSSMGDNLTIIMIAHRVEPGEQILEAKFTGFGATFAGEQSLIFEINEGEKKYFLVQMRAGAFRNTITLIEVTRAAFSSAR